MAPARAIAKELSDFRPDVVHLASPFTVGGPAVRAAASLGVPVVSVYQTDVAGFATRYGLGITGDVAWRRIRSVHNRSGVTLAPSLTAADDLVRHGVERVQLWPRGVDTDAFSPRHRDPSLHDRLGGGHVLVGYLGRLAPEKQVEDLAALSGLPGVQIVVIGDGPARDNLERALPSARFLGLLQGRALSQAVASLDVSVQTGPHETFCQSAQEAMASGVPVVAVGAGGVAELVDSSRTGWLYPRGELSAMAAAVADLAGDAAKRQAMGRAALESVRSRTWPVVCEQLMSHYVRVQAEAMAQPTR